MCIQMIMPSLCDLSCQTFFLLLVSYLLFVLIFVHFVSSVYHGILLLFLNMKDNVKYKKSNNELHKNYVRFVFTSSCL